MSNHANEFPVVKMSSVLKVSSSGYYDWVKLRKDAPPRHRDLDVAIKTAFESSRCTYGSPRVYDLLKLKSVQTSKSTVARRMKACSITPEKKKKFKHTTDSNHNYRISPNLLKQCFEAKKLGQIWVGDITYIELGKGHVYLTTVIDLADRMVIGWSLSSNMTDQSTTIAALEKAIKNRPVDKGLIFHSDRGSQYASKDFRKLLDKHKCIQSMSRKGNCWDNAVAESFFKTIKVEELYHHEFKTIEQVYSVIFDYIDGWYNTLRIHSTLGGISPSQKAKLLAA